MNLQNLFAGGGLAGQLKAMQSQMEATRNGLALKTVEASDDKGLVSITMTGCQETTAVTVFEMSGRPTIEDVEALEHAIMQAVNRAVAASKEMAAKELAKIVGIGGL